MDVGPFMKALEVRAAMNFNGGYTQYHVLLQVHSSIRCACAMTAVGYGVRIIVEREEGLKWSSGINSKIGVFYIILLDDEILGRINY